MSGALAVLATTYASAAAGGPASGYTGWYTPLSIQETAGIVTAWNDVSGNGYHFGTAHSSPLYQASAINGEAGVRFINALSTSLSSTATLGNLVSAAAYTIYAVYIFSGYNGTGSGFNTSAGVYSDSGLNLGQGVTNLGSAGISCGHYDGAYESQPATVGTNVKVISEVAYDGVDIFLRVNGSTIGNVAAGNISTTTGTMQCGTASNVITGYLCELIFYNTNLSGGNKTTTRSYLGTKYAGSG